METSSTSFLYLPSDVLKRIIEKATNRGNKELRAIRLTCKYLFQQSNSKQILKKRNIFRQRHKLPMITPAGLSISNRCAEAKNEGSLLLLGTHLMFIKHDLEKGLPMLHEACKGNNTDTLPLCNCVTNNLRNERVANFNGISKKTKKLGKNDKIQRGFQKYDSNSKDCNQTKNVWYMRQTRSHYDTLGEDNNSKEHYLSKMWCRL